MIRALFGLAAILWVAAASIEAPPYIAANGVRNAASMMPPSLPGGAIARGSLISIRGARLGPDGTRVLLGGVPIQVISASETRILARVPADAGLGEASIAVARNGQVGPERTIHIVPSSPGLYGPHLDNEFERPRRAPGSEIRIRTNGLGDARDIMVRLGGIGISKVDREGDWVRFAIPNAVPPGCEVPLLLRAGGVWSNTISVTVERSPGACVESSDWGAGFSRQAGRIGSVLLIRTALRMEAERFHEDHSFDLALASFSEVRPGEDPKLFELPPAGTCTAYNGIFELGGALNPPRTSDMNAQLMDLNIPFRLPDHKMLQAGPVLRIAGPGGSRQVQHDPQQPDYYLSFLGGTVPGSTRKYGELFLAPGKYSIGSEGSSEVGPFTASSEVPAPLIWENRDSLRRLNRDHGVTFSWRDGSARMVLVVAAAMDPRDGAAGLALCVARPATSRFTIPPEMLANLPSTGAAANGGLSIGGAAVIAVPGTRPESFKARGLDDGIVVPVSIAARELEVR